jgi:hypothetical protein
MKAFRMMSVRSYGWLLVVIVLAVAASGQQPAPAPAPAAGQPAAQPALPDPERPYIAEIVGTNVARSGPAAYYFTAKLSTPAKITVVDHKFTWAQIPAGREPWVHKSNVKLIGQSRHRDHHRSGRADLGGLGGHRAAAILRRRPSSMTATPSSRACRVQGRLLQDRSAGRGCGSS